MHNEIVIAGSGGQGVLLIGRLLAEAGSLEGHEVVWLPSYGAEKRGGTVSCNVTIADEKIGSLTITHPNVAVAMSLASLGKLEPIVKANGILIINKSLITTKPTREDVRAVYVPANEMAKEFGSDSAANMVVLGSLVKECSAVSPSSLEAAMDIMFARNPKALETNKKAFAKGLSYH